PSMSRKSWVDTVTPMIIGITITHLHARDESGPTKLHAEASSAAVPRGITTQFLVNQCLLHPPKLCIVAASTQSTVQGSTPNHPPTTRNATVRPAHRRRAPSGDTAPEGRGRSGLSMRSPATPAS